MIFGATVDEGTMISNIVKYNVNMPGCVLDDSAYWKAAWPSVAQCKGIREIFACGIRKPGPEYSRRNPESH